jgi:hypothetical protein
MKRFNFTLDGDTIELLNKLADTFYKGNKSLTVRAALESLATHAGHDGWIIAGYTALRTEEQAECHSCGKEHEKGEVLFKPVFERGNSPGALQSIPGEDWLECSVCVESK